jgi:hypothetical protein
MTTRTTTSGPLTAAMLALVLAMLSLPSSGAAQSPPDQPGVAMVNESNQEVRVYAFHDAEEERIIIGWLGGGDTDYFQIPDAAISPDGRFRVAVQRILPLPQIGVPATPHPIIPSPMLSPAPNETARLVLDGNMTLTHNMVP